MRGIKVNQRYQQADFDLVGNANLTQEVLQEQHRIIENVDPKIILDSAYDMFIEKLHNACCSVTLVNGYAYAPFLRAPQSHFVHYAKQSHYSHSIFVFRMLPTAETTHQVLEGLLECSVIRALEVYYYFNVITKHPKMLLLYKTNLCRINNSYLADSLLNKYTPKYKYWLAERINRDPHFAMVPICVERY